MLTEQEIKSRIKQYCNLQDESDFKRDCELTGRIKGLCETLDADFEYMDQWLSKMLLESVGIEVLQVNPWRFT